jgi:hypothetical protein
MVKRDCTQWLGEVNAAIPSILVSARDEHGRDLLDAIVVVDGKRVPVDGTPIRLDPGKHTVTFRHDEAGSVEQVVILMEGEKARPMTATLHLAPHRSEPSLTPEPRRRIPTLSYVLGGTGVVALGLGTYFSLRGASDRASAGCDRGCSESDFSRVNREFIAADIALGIGILTAAAAVGYWFLNREETRPRAMTWWPVPSAGAL